MLKFKYSVNSSSDRQEVFLDDIYVSPDLSFMSGTTSHGSSCTVGGHVWVRSSYFPDEIMMNVMAVDVVKRNGYILSPLTLQVYTGYVLQEDGGSTNTVEVHYCEYLGNTYYESVDNKFVIDGREYVSDNSFVTIQSKHYIEDGKVSIDGISYNVFINNGGDASFTDYIGEPFAYPSSWEIHSYRRSTNIEKIVIGGNTPDVIGCKSAKYYGHRGYVVYGEDKKYIQYFVDSGGTVTGAGVIIDGAQYDCTNLFDIKDYLPGNTYNIYNITDYYAGEGDRPYMEINGAKYVINFEPGEIEGSGIICIETKEEYPKVLIDDRIIVKKTGFSKTVMVETDEMGVRYAYLNRKRYNVIDNLCDCVLIGGIEYPLSYEQGPSNVSSGTIASVTMGDGSVAWFMVTGLDSAKQVYKVNDDWQDMYVIVKSESGNAVSYKKGPVYTIVHHDGILLGEQKLQVKRYEYFSSSGTSAETYYSYEYVNVNSMLEYGLKVINTVGSNRILCIPDVDVTLYDRKATGWLTTDILSSVQGEDFVIEKRSNAFGNTDLYADTWMTEASLYSGGTSAYELADIQNNIKVFNISPRLTIPMQLSRNTNGKIAYDDLIRSLYCVEEDDKSINRIVDMEKDIYSPVFSGESYVDVESIVFNLHFRTRDLDTWKINMDEGTYTSSGQTVNLSANYQYANWFITDYYPFYDYARDFQSSEWSGVTTFNPVKFSEVIERSDLLGFMYFTTDDARVGREKLRKSFLRLTFFDSKNPEKQNLLGTSTVFLDCDRYMNLLYSEEFKYHYEECYASRNPNRTQSGSGDSKTRIDIMYSDINAPTVLTQAFSGTTTADLYMGDGNVVLDSRIRVNDRYSGENSSEGFYTYILKAFADKKRTKTIYMKAEFFHAGLGIKVPMVLPTTYDTYNGSYSAVTEWDDGIYNDFLNGYELNSVFDRMYIPITIEYSKALRKFVYYVQYEGGYMNAVNKDGKEWMINLFELKTKPQ